MIQSAKVALHDNGVATQAAHRGDSTRFAASLDRFPRVALGRFPSPLVRVELENGGRFFVKDDGACSEVYGGNKVRKLEFLLAEARQRRQNRLVVHGDVESHTVQACGLLGVAAGFGVQAVVFPHRGQSWQAPELGRLSGAGVRVHRRRSMLAAVLSAHWIGWRTNAYVVPLGASSTAAVLGHVNGALELMRQFRELLQPEPRQIYIAFATGGSVAGLLIGLALAGATTRVVAVQTVEGLIANRRRLERLVKETLALLGLRVCRFDDCLGRLDFIESRYLGRGYRDVPEATQTAMRVAEQHGLGLEPAFSGKAFAAMLGALPRFRDDELLFWNTNDRRRGCISKEGVG